jgi:hypothetical protein
MPLKQKTAARIKRRDVLFDTIDEHGAVVHAHVEREALIDYAGRRSIQGEPDEILEAALPEILRVASDKFPVGSRMHLKRGLVLFGMDRSKKIGSPSSRSSYRMRVRRQ